ncbi:MAG TPA: hypothetical protein VM869_36465, partial [Enhygromyxa sp.]|nr:hypothetical protein [Enhygromyxa sp.]
MIEQRSPKPTPARAKVVASFYLGLALVGFLWHAISQEDNDFWRAADTTVIELLWTPVLGLALGLVVVAGFRVLERWFAWLPALHREFRSILGRPSGSEILLLAAASSLGEE